ncbi:hypothetical protein OS493_010924 [Desmophyllum pertusum]|uniref:Peptidase S74 domain-containing protein n=1 Tax=Desmophyllum pertusum TaxID=174260 RepID=A0A9W9ZEU0_9CNID|nr:hypothetical protein OS493_010924 [Desmophyllum pertusum]
MEALAGLAETLKDAINSNSWHDFANTYQLLERDLCRRSKDELLQRASAMTARELESNMINIFVKFSERCRLDSERSLLKDVELPRMLEEKRKREEEDRKRKSEEDGWYNWARNNGLPIYSGIITLANLAHFFSDERLKQDIVAVQFPSQYHHIGLQEVCWKWNEIAEKNFGLRGEGCGVIAQEVTKTYPWAVIKGKDGYLRVQYDILHEMIINNSDVSRYVTYCY